MFRVRDPLAAAGADHVRAGHHLDPFTALLRTEGHLVRVETFPFRPRRVVDAVAGQVLQDGVGFADLGCAESGQIREQAGDRLGRIGFGVSDESDGSAFDPAGDVGALDQLAVEVQDPAGIVRDHTGVMVERQVGQVRREVTDRAVDGLHRPIGEFSCASGGSVADQLRAFGSQPFDPFGAEHRDRGLAQMDVDAVLARHPEIALVDELAHTNVPGLRNRKRWEDIEELLAAGIDVTAHDEDGLAAVADAVRRCGTPARLQLKVDTGLHRNGCLPADWPEPQFPWGGE